MYGRVILPIDDLEENLKMIEEYFKPMSFEYSKSNEDEVICLGKSAYFEREWGLHNIILLDDGDFELWSVKEEAK